MSYCPRPPKTKKTNYGTPATKTVSAPAPRTEGCNPAYSEVVSGGGSSTSSTVYVPSPGPKGDKGDKGDPGLNGLSWELKGEWTSGTEYKTADANSSNNDERIYHVVVHNGQTYICTQNHTADGANEPQLDGFNGPTDWQSYWTLVAKQGTAGLNAQEKTFFDTLGDIYDWVTNASVEELIGAGITAIGIGLAATAVIDMIADDGAGDGEADQRFDGTPGYVSTGFKNPDIKQVIQALCSIDGIATDVSALPDDECAFVIGNVTSPRNVLGQLALAYQFEMVDTGGVLRFVPRSASAVKVIDMSDMGVDELSNGGSDLPAPWTAQRLNGINLPKTVSLTYYSPDLDYNKFTQSSSYATFDEGQDISLSVPVVLTHEKAKQITEISLIQSHLEGQNYEFTTTYKHIDLEAGDIIDITKNGQFFATIRITRVEESKEGVLSFSAVDAGSVESLLSSNMQVATPPASTNVPTVIGYSQGIFIDPNAINSSDTSVRVYVGVHGYDAPGWPGAQIYMSENGGSSYEPIATAYQEATVGLVASPVANHSYYGWDMDTEITVQVKTNTLLSVSKLDVLNGKNWCMIGKEIIGFTTATLIAPKTYKLTGLLRGRQGTEQHVGTHQANELFIMLDNALVKLEFNASDRGSTKKYKIVTIGSSIDKANPVEVQMFSSNTLPWQVYKGKIEKSGSDFIVSWKESARFDNQIRDLTTQKHDPNWGGFQIDVYSGSTIVKKYRTTSDTWTYSASMQTADFGGLQSSLKVAVAQIDNVYGPGYSVTLNS